MMIFQEWKRKREKERERKREREREGVANKTF